LSYGEERKLTYITR